MSDRPEHGWLIHKRGRGWYRPNAQGYTAHSWEAGRYSHAEALGYSHPNGLDGPRDGMTIKHESEVQDSDGSLKSRLLAIDHGDGGSQWPRNPDGVEAVREIKKLGDQLDYIEREGTEEINAAIELRQKLAQVRVENTKLRGLLEIAGRRGCDHCADDIRQVRAGLKGGDDE